MQRVPTGAAAPTGEPVAGIPAYFDNAATTPLRPETLDAMLPWLSGGPANPSGSHQLARAARRAVDEARDVVAASLGCQPGEVVFTSGGTEADNLAVLGAHRARPGQVLCSAVEHAAVLGPCRSVGGSTVPVDEVGRVDVPALRAELHRDVVMVAVMAVNNEVGTVQPLEEVVAVVREAAPGAVVHADAVAAVPWLDVASVTSGCDLVAVTAHKFGGPHGVGALVVRDGTPWVPVLSGGSQERARRPGTVDVAGVVGMAAALQASVAERAATVTRVGALRDRLVAGLVSSGCGARPTLGADFAVLAVAGTAHMTFDGVEAEELLLLLDRCGICASAGSACASGAMEPSHVLLAMGAAPAAARQALRFSLGRDTTAEDVDRVVDRVPALVDRLRS